MGVKFNQLCGHSIRGVRYIRPYHNTSAVKNIYNCKLLIVGAGAGGCSIAWRFAKKLKQNEIIVLEPSQIHYYQPQFTLVAAGIKPFKEAYRPTAAVLPSNVVWLRDRAEDFDPCHNVVYTTCGDKISYEFMVVALGLVNDYDQIPGLRRALSNPQDPVTTIYAPNYCQDTWALIQKFRGGLALFTRPKKGGKCSGASHCVTYLADDYWRKNKIREQTSMAFVTGDEVIYGVPKYATALNRVAADRMVAVNYNMELSEITARGAVFVDEGGGSVTLPYTFLHVTPCMRPPVCLTRCEALVTETGYLDVHRRYLQHWRYHNVFGIGDCIGTPNSKTAAAVATQSPIVARNLTSVMRGKRPSAEYNGYGACPIITSYRTGMLAEFTYDKQLKETFPFDQSKESRLLYTFKKDVMPHLYWKTVKGKWNGPGIIRRIINPFGW